MWRRGGGGGRGERERGKKKNTKQGVLVITLQYFKRVCHSIAQRQNKLLEAQGKKWSAGGGKLKDGGRVGGPTETVRYK